MRHLHFVQSIETTTGGGLGKAALDLHRQLLRQRQPSTLVTTTSGARYATIERVQQYRRKGPERLFYSPALRKAAADLVEEADIIHGHGFYVYPNKVIGRHTRRQNKPLVYHPHGMLEPYILDRSRMKKWLVHMAFEDANFRYARLWRALTMREAEQIRAAGISAPIVVAPNGVHLDEFDQRDLASLPLAFTPAENNQKTLLFMGRLHVKKGLDLLREAWTRLRPWTLGWRLVIAGPDESGLIPELDRWAREIGEPEALLVTGPLYGDDKIAALRSSTAFVLPSYSEGFPISILEAMTCRLPVVATYNCNLPEIEEADAGWLCEPTVESLEIALSRLFAASNLELEQRAEAARMLVERRFTWEKAAEPLLEACAKL